MDTSPIASRPSEDPWCGAWLGREETQRATVSLKAVAALAATLDVAAPAAGEPLPPGWQWLLFNPVAPGSSLGEDGHPLRTPESFLPPLTLPRRMWAGSRVQYLAPLEVGAEAVRTSRIERIAPKEGNSGRMCFVTVVHRIASGGRDCIVEEQDIVYREASQAGAPPEPGPVEPPVSDARWQRLLRPDPVLLFRYSALTFNGHRIHYDRPYAREVEHYRDLVVHGPLTATLLQGLAVECRPERRLAGFEFRGLQPLFVNQPLLLCAELDGADGNGGKDDTDTLRLCALAPDGSPAMEASAVFHPAS